MSESIRRLAVYRPAAVICLAGAPDPARPAESRRLVVNSFREAAKVAADVGVRLAIEVISPGAAGSLAPTIPAALELAADAGAGDMGVLVDAWHSAAAPGTAADIATYVDRVAGIQVCDRTADSRGWYDRAYPGMGTLPLTEMVRAARQAGYGGWYEMEIFSDDGKLATTTRTRCGGSPRSRCSGEAWTASVTSTARRWRGRDATVRGLRAGAIGGLIAARLHQSGQPVTTIARGRQLAALQSSGLRLDSPDGTAQITFPAVASPAAVAWQDDACVILAMKSQDTAQALEALMASAPPSVTVVCAQNGVENERAALRRFPRTVGMCMNCPATFLEPGVVTVMSARPTAVSTWPFPAQGVGEDPADSVAAALRAADFDAIVRADIMPWKYAKLLVNLGNAVEALCGPQARGGEFEQRLRAEAQQCLAAAGIGYVPAAQFGDRMSALRLPWQAASPGAAADPPGRAWPGGLAGLRPTTSTGR